MVSSGISKVRKLGSVTFKGYLWEQYNKMENSGSDMATCGSGIAKWEPVGYSQLNGILWPLKE